MRTGLTTANGLRFHAVTLGDGPPVVMLHGLLVGNLATWFFTGARVLAKTHRVLLYDLRGHGRSERPATGYDVATMAGDLEALVAGFTDEPVALVGHSFGALVAMHYARAHPEGVTRLAVVEAPLMPGDADELAGFLSLPPEEMLAALPGELRETIVGGGRRATRLLASLEALATETTLVADLAARDGVDDEELRAVRCPLLAVYGDRSPCLPSGQRFAAVLPEARLEILPGGHYLPLDAPAAIGRLLAEFLGG